MKLTGRHYATRYFVAAFVSLVLAGCQAQDAPPETNDITIGKKYSLFSSVLQEEREYLVYLPQSYDSETYAPQSYPVLYLLDGSAHFLSVSGTIDFMSTGNNGNRQIPELIVVAIPNTDRTRDLTPTHTTLGFDGEETTFLESSGGGEKFLQFIRGELFPRIEADYRTLEHRTLVGHSFGGLIALHALVNAPEMFNATIAIDPSLWWDGRQLVSQAADVFANDATRSGAVYISMASHPDRIRGSTDVMQESARQFAASLSRAASPSIRSELQLFAAEDHGSVPLRSLYHGLLSIFEGYKIGFGAATENADALVSHYAEMSQRLGIELRPPEAMVDQLGYNFLEYLEKPDDALDLFQVNAANYPHSANVYVSLGEVYHVKGETQLAIDNLEKALELDPDHYWKEWTQETLNELRD